MTVRTGTFGDVSADEATALAMALVELLANAIEHGAADVELRSHRDEAGLAHRRHGRGRGLPEGLHGRAVAEVGAADRRHADP